MNQDPTRNEMLTFLCGFYPHEAEQFDREEAIYWFANDWHGGQSSNLYSALSTSEYKPGMNERCPPADSVDAMMYEALETKFTAWGKEAAETWGDGYDSASR